MRNVVLLGVWLTIAGVAFAQAPPAAPRPAQPPVATQAPAPATPPAPRRPAAPASTRSGMAITVTDLRGATLAGIRVEVSGAVPRMGDTNEGGQINFPGLQAGTYRLRFSGETVTTFEKEVTLRAAQIADVEVTLSPAPPKPEPPPPPPPVVLPPPPPVVGPTGQPQALSIPDLLEREFVGRQPRRETLLSCSGSTRTTMIQLNEAQADRLYATADAIYYVIGGEGTAMVNGRDVKLATNGFVSVPRGATHALQRRGNRPLILLAVLSGEPCEEAR